LSARSLIRFNPTAEEGRPNLTSATAVSDAFFERPKNRVWAQTFYRALIDRDRSFAQTFYAFDNLAALAAPDYWIIAIHGHFSQCPIPHYALL
jgi:hypothetical protein